MSEQNRVQIVQRAREACATLRDAAREGRVIHFRQRDPLVAAIHTAINIVERLAQPSESAPQEAEKAIRQLSPRSPAVDVLTEDDHLGRIAVNAVAEFVGPASARVIAVRLTASSSQVAASGSQGEGPSRQALVPLPDAADELRREIGLLSWEHDTTGRIAPQAVQGSEGSFPASVEAIMNAQKFCSRLLDEEVSGDTLTAYEEQAIDIIKALLVLSVPSPEPGQE